MWQSFSMTVGKLSKYKNVLFTQVINKPSIVYITSKDSEKWVDSKYERTFIKKWKLIPAVIFHWFYTEQYNMGTVSWT